MTAWGGQRPFGIFPKKHKFWRLGSSLIDSCLKVSEQNSMNIEREKNNISEIVYTSKYFPLDWVESERKAEQHNNDSHSILRFNINSIGLNVHARHDKEVFIIS